MKQSAQEISCGELAVIEPIQNTEPKLELEPELFKNYTDSPDVEIIVTDSNGAQTSFKAHRTLLEKYEYFNMALSEKWQRGSETYIEISGVDPSAMKDILSYLYRGEFKLAPDSVEIYQALDFLLLADAGEKLLEYLIITDYFDTLDPEGFALHLTAVASLPEGSELKERLEIVLFGFVALRSTDLQTLPFYFEKTDSLTSRIYESLQLGPKKLSSLIALGEKRFPLIVAIHKKETVRILEEALERRIKEAVRRGHDCVCFSVDVGKRPYGSAEYTGAKVAVEAIKSKYSRIFKSFNVHGSFGNFSSDNIHIEANLF